MKKSLQLFTAVFLLLFASSLEAQYGYGNRYGRRTSIPQAQTPQKEPEPKTAEEYVEERMPKIIEALELDPFEEAVVRTTLTKYVQKRMELQILKLDPKKMKEEFEKIQKLQDAEIKAGLPEEKYENYLALQKNQLKKKRKKKKKRKDKTD
ncbi:hypothetical protein [Flagellimonas lutaonensis]|uniref:DUF4890 domain-containing protein n=1 Tax=Flagellimonas lutaonensis TaxID=516051 RepID=A0A0D5YWC8_9FLAO|nr:hypothetical protein [Allomuricauda lutaonensis]AKA36204.1 hypothetical protein VC82_2642 [Allomuricauda lutaonensis]